jgi:hypothetical protein
MVINYEQESLRLESYVPESSSDYWKAKPGQYRVKAVSEIEESKPYTKKDKEGKVIEEQQQRQIKFLLSDKQYTWTFSLGKTSASTYGQLVSLAKSLGGSLNGKEFMIVVVASKGKDNTEKNTYTIVKL